MIKPSYDPYAVKVLPAITGKLDKPCDSMVKLSVSTGCTLKTEEHRRLSGSFMEESKMSQTKPKKSKTGKCKNGILKRGSTYSYIYYITDPITGKNKPKMKGGFKTRAEAEEAKIQTEAAIMQNRYREPTKMTVSEYMTHWFENIHKPTLSPNSARGYEVNIRCHLLPYIGKVKLVDLNRENVSALYAKLIDKGLSPTSVKYVHNTLNKGLNEAVLNELIPRNPCNGIKLPRREKYHATVLTNEQCRTLLDAAANTPIAMELLLTATLGLRRGEALGLTFDDFDLVAGTVRIQKQITSTVSSKDSEDGKTHWGFAPLKTAESHRTLYLTPQVIAAVKQRAERVKHDRLKYGDQYHDMGLVCCNEKGEPTNPYTFRTEFKKLLKCLGLPDMRIHDLRHTFATAIIESNAVPLKTVSHALGHSSISITADIYCDVINSSKDVCTAAQKCFFESTEIAADSAR